MSSLQSFPLHSLYPELLYGSPSIGKMTSVVLECYPASVESNFEPFMYVVSQKPPMCHRGDTMCQIKNRKYQTVWPGE